VNYVIYTPESYNNRIFDIYELYLNFCRVKAKHSIKSMDKFRSHENDYQKIDKELTIFAFDGGEGQRENISVFDTFVHKSLKAWK
jgi:hypothetical protein